MALTIDRGNFQLTGKQTFTDDGTFTVPDNVGTVYLTGCGAGGGIGPSVNAVHKGFYASTAFDPTLKNVSLYSLFEGEQPAGSNGEANSITGALNNNIYMEDNMIFMYMNSLSNNHSLRNKLAFHRLSDARYNDISFTGNGAGLASGTYFYVYSANTTTPLTYGVPRHLSEGYNLILQHKNQIFYAVPSNNSPHTASIYRYRNYSISKLYDIANSQHFAGLSTGNWGIQFSVPNNTSNTIYALFTLNPSGLANNILCISNDNGLTWSKKNVASISTGTANYAPCLLVSTPNILYHTTSSQVINTSVPLRASLDQGNTWSNCTFSNSSTFFISAIYYDSDANAIFIHGDRSPSIGNVVFKSTNSSHFTEMPLSTSLVATSGAGRRYKINSTSWFLAFAANTGMPLNSGGSTGAGAAFVYTLDQGNTWSLSQNVSDNQVLQRGTIFNMENEWILISKNNYTTKIRGFFANGLADESGNYIPEIKIEGFDGFGSNSSSGGELGNNFLFGAIYKNKSLYLFSRINGISMDAAIGSVRLGLILFANAVGQNTSFGSLLNISGGQSSFGLQPGIGFVYSASQQYNINASTTIYKGYPANGISTNNVYLPLSNSILTNTEFLANTSFGPGYVYSTNSNYSYGKGASRIIITDAPARANSDALGNNNNVRAYFSNLNQILMSGGGAETVIRYPIKVQAGQTIPVSVGRPFAYGGTGGYLMVEW